MIRALFWTLALSAITAAALLVPLQGKSIWQRAQDRGVPQAVGHGIDASIDWAKSLTEGPEDPTEPPEAAKPPPKKSAAAQARSAKKPKVEERLSREDRAELDAIVTGRR